MNKTEVNQIIANGSKPLARVKMADGRYFGTKENDDYTVLQESGDSWAPLSSPKDATKGKNIIVLNDCKDAKTGTKRTIAVNDEFIGWSLGTGFSFEVKKGRTSLDLKQFTAKEMKQLVSESVN